MRVASILLAFFTIQSTAIAGAVAQKFEFSCSSRNYENIKVLINKSEKTAALYTKAPKNKRFINNGKFECVDSSDIKIHASTSEKLICGQQVIDTKRKLMGKIIQEMPALKVNNGYKYRINFLETLNPLNLNLIVLQGVKLEVEAPSFKNGESTSYELNLPCKSIDSRI